MSHAHRHGDPAKVAASPAARTTLLAFLVLAALATVVGLVALWPDHAPKVEDPAAAFAAPGVTFHEARVESVQPRCASVAKMTESCGHVTATVLSGSEKGRPTTIQVTPEVSSSGLRKDDVLELMQSPPRAGQSASFTFFSVHRTTPITLMLVLFVLVVAAVARLRGLLSLVGLALGAAVVVTFMLPALLNGSSGLGVALVGSSAIMFVVLYLAHGVSLRTSAALAGTLLGVALTALIGLVAISWTRLSGISDETGALLSSFVTDLDFQGLLTCAVIIAGLGVLNDVTITQASAVWELRDAGPELGRAELFGRAMRIGRDHIASTIYTIVFAYAGAALSVLMLLYFYERPWLSVLSTEEISEEVIRTLASGIGLVLAVPITTAIAAFTVEGPRRAGD